MEIKYINRANGNIETERPPAEGLLKFLYDNPFGKTAILPIAKRKFITEWYGRKMDRPSSTKRIPDFVSSLGINMEESAKSIEEFTSFNDFFYRKLKPGVRPIGSGLVSPGDGKLLAFQDFSEVNQFYVKGRAFTLKEFLGDDALADRYRNASMIILRLAPNDYHRYHFPYDGAPTISKRINGDYYSVSPYALAGNFTKVFCENKRELCTLKLAKKKDMLLLPVGATMVGSIHSTYVPESDVKKGDEMGYFAFGGSTIVMIFDADDFTIDEDLRTNTQNKIETFVRMGETIGR